MARVDELQEDVRFLKGVLNFIARFLATAVIHHRKLNLTSIVIDTLCSRRCSAASFQIPLRHHRSFGFTNYARSYPNARCGRVKELYQFGREVQDVSGRVGCGVRVLRMGRV